MQCHLSNSPSTHPPLNALTWYSLPTAKYLTGFVIEYIVDSQPPPSPRSPPSRPPDPLQRQNTVAHNLPHTLPPPHTIFNSIPFTSIFHQFLHFFINFNPLFYILIKVYFSLKTLLSLSYISTYKFAIYHYLFNY